MSDWNEIAGRLGDVALDLAAIADDASRLVGDKPRKDVGRFDPRKSQLKAAQFAASLGYAASDLERKAERIEEVD